MQRLLAAAAVVFGVLGLTPMLLFWLSVLLGLDLLQVMELPWRFLRYLFGGLSGEAVGIFISVLVAPILLLWGLVGLQRTERGRGRVVIWTTVLCVCTAPFGAGLILCLPLFLFMILPIMRQFRSARLASPPEASRSRRLG